VSLPNREIHIGDSIQVHRVGGYEAGQDLSRFGNSVFVGRLEESIGAEIDVLGGDERGGLLVPE
jgi:hypothetical protein